MAKLHADVIEALRTTAARLRDGAEYQWGHAGVCNCGHLAQTVTRRSKAQIYSMVGGEWSEHLRDRCPVTGGSVEDVAAQLIRFGFGPSELRDLERLEDPRVLAALGERRYLRRNERDDVVLYLETWAKLLEAELQAA